jgi:dihydrofolate reductase
MKTQYYTASSLDGFIADPEHSLDWLMQFGNVDQTSYPTFIEEVGAIAMGSNTYEWILDHVGPRAAPPQAWPYDQPTWVLTSRSLPSVHPEIRFASGDVRPVHAQLTAAANGKNIWIVGGGELAASFYDRGLLDEVIVQIAGVTLGAGAPLFPRRIAIPPLQLTSVERYREIVEVRYSIPRLP